MRSPERTKTTLESTVYESSWAFEKGVSSTVASMAIANASMVAVGRASRGLWSTSLRWIGCASKRQPQSKPARSHRVLWYAPAKTEEERWESKYSSLALATYMYSSTACRRRKLKALLSGQVSSRLPLAMVGLARLRHPRDMHASMDGGCRLAGQEPPSIRLVGEVSAGLVAGWTVVACEIGNAGRSSTHAL